MYVDIYQFHEIMNYDRLRYNWTYLNPIHLQGVAILITIYASLCIWLFILLQYMDYIYELKKCSNIPVCPSLCN